MNNYPSLTRAATRSAFNYGHIVILAAFLINLMNVGMFVTIGVFFKPIINDLGWTRAVTSGTVSVATIVSGVVSILVGTLTDRFGPRKIALTCGIISGSGYLLLSGLTSVWQLYIYFGIMVGSGISLLTSLLSLVPRWFTNGRTVMAGIISAGGGVGGLILPLVTNWLIEKYNWHQTYLIMGIVYLVIVVTSALLLKSAPARPIVDQQPENQPRKAVVKPLYQANSLKEILVSRPFLLMLAFFFAFGVIAITIQVHLVPHATDININSTAAAGLLSIMNGVSIIGCVVLGAIGDKYGNKLMLAITFFFMGLMLFFLVPAKELWMLNLIMVIYGLAFGSGLAQTSPMVARYFGMSSIGLLLGITNFAQTIGCALGGFFAGFIFDITGTYELIFIICGALGLIGLLATVLIRPGKSKNIA